MKYERIEFKQQDTVDGQEFPIIIQAHKTNGLMMVVAINEDNRHYQEIKKAIADGDLIRATDTTYVRAPEQ